MRRIALDIAKRRRLDEKTKSQAQEDCLSIRKQIQNFHACAKGESLPDERREAEGCGNESAARESYSGKAG